MPGTKPSKSALKRDSEKLQKLGERLIALTEEQLSSIDTEERLLDQVRAARKISAHGALRRQKQLIGKLMRGVDPAPIRAALARLDAREAVDKALFRDAEAWRDRIAAEGRPALAAFAEATGCAVDEPLQRVTEKIMQSGTSRDRRRDKRQLFRLLHRVLAERADGDQDGARSSAANPSPDDRADGTTPSAVMTTPDEKGSE